MTNSLVRIGTVGVDWVKRAQSVLIRPSSHQQRRHTFSSATPDDAHWRLVFAGVVVRSSTMTWICLTENTVKLLHDNSNAKNARCFYPVPQAANCIQRVVEMAKAPVVYMSTDAAESEIEVLRTLIWVDGKPVPLVKHPPRNSAEKWDALLYRHGLHDDLQVEAMLDKTICAMSSVFIGSSGSTFTEDILLLRKDRGSASGCDEYICQGELPDFIANNE